jgi:iron-sulfur cluster repair protein YtfE (RIC family)
MKLPKFSFYMIGVRVVIFSKEGVSVIMSAQSERLTFEVLLRHLATEHQALHQVLSDLEVNVAKLATMPKDLCLCQIRELAGKLRDELAHHFRQEESGGFMEEAVARRPQIGPVVDQLIAEHPVLIKSVESLIDACDAAAVGEVSCTKLRQEFEHVAKQLVDHKERENQAIQLGYNVDYSHLLS